MASREVEIVMDRPAGTANNSHPHEVAVREQGQIVHAQERTADEIIARLDKIKEVQKKAMESGIDYGVIPGTERKDAQGKDISKPTLLKAGAEKLCVLFNLDAQFVGDGNSEQIIVENLPDGTVIRHLLVKRYCTIYSQVSQARLGGASSICSTLESKYAYRKAARVCPNCGKENIRRSRQADQSGDQGWYCWAKTGGCGGTFISTDPKITEQKEGRVPNIDVADQFNTVVRIGEKRALVAAVRLVTGASAIFDEESPDIENEQASNAPGAAAKSDSKASGAKTNPKPASKIENAPTGTQAQATTQSKTSEGAGVPPAGSDGGPPSAANPSETTSKPKIGKVTPEQAKELADLYEKVPPLAGLTKEQDFARTLKMVSAPAGGDFGDVPAPNFKVLKQMFEKRIENATKGAGVSA